MAYMTGAVASTRLLDRYGFTATLTDGLVAAASLALDNKSAYLGERYVAGQALAFPRTYTAPGDTEGVVPEAVLDWVALEAYKLSREDEPAVSSKSVQHLGSKTYARPARSQAERLQASLLSAYSRGSAVPIVRAGVRRVVRPFYINDPLELSGPY